MIQRLNTGKENNQSNGEPKPLSSEARSIVLEIDPKKKPQDKNITGTFQNQDYIKNIVETPKESSVRNDAENPTNSNSSNISSEEEKLNQIRQRMNNEHKEPTSLSGSIGESGDDDAPDEETCILYSETIVEVIEFAVAWGLQTYAKDTEDAPYTPSNPKRKAKIIKLLSKILMRAGKKHPVELWLILLIIGTNFPLFRKAQAHREKVLAEREAQKLLDEKSKTQDVENNSSGNKRRRLKQDPEISDATLESEN